MFLCFHSFVLNLQYYCTYLNISFTHFSFANDYPSKDLYNPFSLFRNQSYVHCNFIDIHKPYSELSNLLNTGNITNIKSLFIVLLYFYLNYFAEIQSIIITWNSREQNINVKLTWTISGEFHFYCLILSYPFAKSRTSLNKHYQRYE